MRRIFAAFLCFAFLTLDLPAAPSLAGSDKQLENVHGQVSYQMPGSGQRPLAPRASIVLSDNASALTGSKSLAGVVLPDSSRVMIGSSTKVQIGYFTQAAVASAKFTIPYGRVRFKVEHPKGARANYTFQTPTAQIAVRGTEGDIFSDAAGHLQVNVYALSDPGLPVRVTLANGQVFTLAAGQSLTAGAVAGALSGVVNSVSQATFQPFSEFGAPQNAGSFGISGGSDVTASTGAGAGAGAAPAVGSLTTVAGAILGVFVVNVVVHSVENAFGAHAPAAPQPTATATPSAGVPIVVH